MNETQELSHRQAKILAAIVKEHCDTSLPVGSQDLVEKYNFNVSAPTIRNEMQALEKMGYIAQPYTSAGRVPTDKGFRYFVNQLMDRVSLGMEEQARLKKEMLKLQMAHVETGRRLAKLLSDHSQQASFAIFPEEVSTTGISKILNIPGLPAEDAQEIAKFFDDIDQYAEKMMTEYAQEDSPKTFIGKEIHLSPKSGYSMIVSRLSLPSGKKGVIGLVGPKSMQYEKNLSLLEYISKLIGGTSVILVLFF